MGHFWLMFCYPFVPLDDAKVRRFLELAIVFGDCVRKQAVLLMKVK
jgi:hypothetical protein